MEVSAILRVVLELESLAELVLEELSEVRYAGINGSCLVSNRNSDIDIIAVVEYELAPVLFHPRDKVSILAFDSSWLSYRKHEEHPVGLVPSVLFKSIILSQPLIGSTDSLSLPPIRVCKADWVNLRLKNHVLRTLTGRIIS
jgi:hypothetical protein